MRTIWNVTNRGHRHDGIAAVALLAAVFAVPSVGWGGQVTGSKVAGAEKQATTERNSKKLTKISATKPEADDSGSADDKRAEVPPPMEFEAVKLSDGTEVQVEKWGKTFQAYEYRPPVDIQDKRVHVVIDYQRLGRVGVGISALQIDSVGGKLYWCETTRHHPLGRIICAHLDGGGAETIVSGRREPRNLVLDKQRSRIYWLEGEGASPHTLQTADLAGKNETTIAKRLDQPFGLALDPGRGQLYYWEEYRLVRVNVDGTGEEVVTADARTVRPSISALAFDTAGDKLFAVVAHNEIRCCNRDGSQAEDVPGMHRWASIFGFALDGSHQKLYFTNTSRSLLRANADGSQVEVLVASPDESADGFARSISGDVALDPKRKFLYWTGARHRGVDVYAMIYRMALLPLLRPTGRTSPPRIVAISPTEQKAVGQISLSGEGLAHASAVTFIDDSTGAHSTAKFRSTDDESLTVTVPKLGAHCEHPVIVVQTPSGMTMTLGTSLLVPKPRILRRHERSAAGAVARLWLLSDTLAGGVEEAVVYLERYSDVGFGTKGINTVFAANGSHVRLLRLADTVVYHEPFAIVSPPVNHEPSVRLVPVPAIRPSFPEALLTHLHEPQKRNGD
jgi:hypothetical protein